jgi:hypothetical protein
VRPRLAGVLALVVLASATAGCSSQQEKYCSALEEEKETLAQLSGGSGDPETGVVGETIAVFERLREDAPDDVSDEWDVYITAWRGLDDALTEAGADESMFSDGERPEGMSQEDYEAISAAAVELRSTRVVEAASGIEQHALDVCKVDLNGSDLEG